jgi:hypothetical protein
MGAASVRRRGWADPTHAGRRRSRAPRDIVRGAGLDATHGSRGRSPSRVIRRRACEGCLSLLRAAPTLAGRGRSRAPRDILRGAGLDATHGSRGRSPSRVIARRACEACVSFLRVPVLFPGGPGRVAHALRAGLWERAQAACRIEADTQGAETRMGAASVRRPGWAGPTLAGRGRSRAPRDVGRGAGLDATHGSRGRSPSRAIARRGCEACRCAKDACPFPGRPRPLQDVAEAASPNNVVRAAQPRKSRGGRGPPRLSRRSHARRGPASRP